MIAKCVWLVDYKVWQQWLQSVLGVGLQSVANWITKRVRDHKLWLGRLQSVSGITNCGRITT